MKPILSYYGGKQRLVKTILHLIPPHTLYAEPFFGGGAVFFAKEASKIEVINDTNLELVNFYHVVKNNFPALQREIRNTLYARAAHEYASFILSLPAFFDKVKRAWAVWVRIYQSYASSLNGSWGYGRTENTAVHRFNNKKENCTAIFAKRLEHAQIECTDALKVIRSRDSETSFFYCDPPYIGTHQGHYSGYSEANYLELLKLLATIKGKFLLSSYPSMLLDQAVAQNGWYMVKLDLPIAISSNRAVKTKRKIEVLIANYPIQKFDVK